MNQQCKVCGEPAAGFHFGAFTCEGCKSFFGRSYNNLNSITECKNNGECIINKKNRTACKSCRLRKCLLVGMSKSGSRYGRRSNWFKIHCLLQEQQQAAVAQIKGKNTASNPLENPMPLLSPLGFPHSSLGSFLRPNNSSSPSVSSPDSDSSEPSLYSPRLNGTNPFVHKDFYLSVPFHSMFMHPTSLSSPFLLPPSLLPYTVPPSKHEDYAQRLGSPDHAQRGCNIGSPCDLRDENARSNSPPLSYSPTNNNEYSSNCKSKHISGDVIRNKCNNNCNNNNVFSNSTNNNNNESKDNKVTVQSKRFYLDTILGLKPSKESKHRSSTEERENGDKSPAAFHQEEQDNPIDLSVKSTAYKSDGNSKEVEEAEEEKVRSKAFNMHDEIKPIPLDLSV